MDYQTLSIIVKLQDEASAQLEAMSAKVAAIGDTIGGAISGIGNKVSAAGASMTSFGTQLSSAGTQMSIGLTVPIVALGTAIVETSTKFQASMEMIRTQAGASQAEVDNMTQAVLALSKSGETGQGPQALADGLFHIESLGYRGAAALDILKTSAEAADTGMANMEDVSNALGASIVTGIDGTQTMSGAMGILNATIGAGNMRMADLASALGTGILPAAKNFGLSLTDVGAALATLTDNGMGADEAATRLRMSFSLMAAPTQKATDAMATLGLTQYQLANDMRSGGIVEAMQDLKDHLDASGLSATKQAAVLSEAFGGGRSSAAIMTLVEQTDRLNTKFQDITANANGFAAAVDATHETNMFKLNAAMATVQATLIDLGGTVMPLVAAALVKLTALLVTLVGWWDTLSPSTQKWIAIAVALLAVLGPVAVILGSLITALGTIFTAIGAVTTSLGLFISGMTGAEIATGTFAGELGAAVVATAPLLVALAAVAAAVYVIVNAYEDLQTQMNLTMASGNAAIASSQKLTPIIASTTDPAKKAQLQQQQAQSQQAGQAAIDFANQHSGIGGFFRSEAEGWGSILGNLLPKFQNGGVVPGSAGTPVPIMAHGGETVIPAGQKGGGGDTYVFHFHDVVAGDDGVKSIITQTIQQLNRTSTLRRISAAR